MSNTTGFCGYATQSLRTTGEGEASKQHHDCRRPYNYTSGIARNVVSPGKLSCIIRCLRDGPFLPPKPNRHTPTLGLPFPLLVLFRPGGNHPPHTYYDTPLSFSLHFYLFIIFVFVPTNILSTFYFPVHYDSPFIVLTSPPAEPPPHSPQADIERSHDTVRKIKRNPIET